MKRSTENKGYFLNTIIIIIAVGFLFAFKNQRLPDNQIKHYSNIIELKVSSQAILTLNIDLVSHTKISFDIQTINPVFKTSFERFFDYSVSCNLHQNLCKYLNVKPLFDKPLKQQLLPRYPDSESISFC